jgi:hypothetical protein
MTLILIILLAVVIGGGGFGWHGGYVGYNPIGLILVIVVVLLIFGLIGPRWHG